MTRPLGNLADLLGSRICHDLISPIGAISNGVELIAMSGDIAGPEMSLIAESVENANARIRYFRIAYGVASPEQLIGRREIDTILGDLSHGGRLIIDWKPTQDLPRPEVKLAFLVLQCFESALPRGGRITVSAVGDQWAIQGAAEHIRFESELWQMLATPAADGPLSANTVHFALGGICAADMGREPLIERSPTLLRVRF